MDEAKMKKGKIEDANVDIFYWRLISEFWALTGGVNYVYRPAKTPYFQLGLGIEGLMPYFIETEARTYLHNGSAKLDLELSRDTQISNHVFLKLSIEGIIAGKTVEKDEIGSGLNELETTVRPYYQINSNLALYAQYQHSDYFAARKRILRDEGEAGHENIYSVGLALLF